MKKDTKQKAIQSARENFADPSNDEIEIDDNAKVYESRDKVGYWVSAFVFIRKEDLTP